MNISSVFSIHRKPRDGQASVTYQIIPDKSIVTEGETATIYFTVNKVEGGTTTTLTAAEVMNKEYLNVVGKGDAAGKVGISSPDNYIRLVVPDGYVYGKNYTVALVTRSNVPIELASVTIGVTAKGGQGEKGDPGEDGTSIQIDGDAIKHYKTRSAYITDTKVTGYYLLDEGSEGRVIYKDTYVVYYNASDGTTTQTKVDPGTAYVIDEDGHLYVATKQMGSGMSVTLPRWKDVGNIRGEAARMYALDIPLVIKPGTNEFNIVVTRTNGTEFKRLTYEEATADYITLTGDYVEWNESDQQFYLEAGATKDATYSITLRWRGYVIQTYRVQCVGSGSNGIQGCILRMCGEWDATRSYVNEHGIDRDTLRYIDIVCIKDELSEELYWYSCKQSNTNHRPTGTKDDTYWTPADKQDFIATDILISENILTKILQGRYIYCTDEENHIVAGMQSVKDEKTPMLFAGASQDNANEANYRVYKDGTNVARKFKTADYGTRVEITNGIMSVFGNNGIANIRFGVNEYGQAIMAYYDDNGNKLYDLGPQGIVSAVTVTLASYVPLAAKLFRSNDTSIGKVIVYSQTFQEQAYRFLDGTKKIGNEYWYSSNVEKDDPEGWATHHTPYHNRYYANGGKTAVANNTLVAQGWYFTKLPVTPITGLVCVMVYHFDVKGNKDNQGILYLKASNQGNYNPCYSDGRPYNETSNSVSQYIIDTNGTMPID